MYAPLAAADAAGVPFRSARRAAEAERSAREAVAILEPTDALRWRGEALTDLAQVLETAGRLDEAAAARPQALERYERKGLPTALPVQRQSLAVC
jgi:hypothetical protein